MSEPRQTRSGRRRRSRLVCGNRQTEWRFIAAVLASSIAQTLPESAVALETSGSGWVLEHFGTDVTILRRRGAPPRETEMMLSCEGKDRRFRLVLPEDVAGRLGGSRTGSILIQPPGGPSSGQAAIVTRYALIGDRIVTLSEDEPNASGSAILSIGRILTEQPASLSLLIHPGPPPVLLNRLIALHVPLAFGAGDAAALRDFVETCARDGR